MEEGYAASVLDEEASGGPVGAGGVEARAQRGRQPGWVDGIRGMGEAQMGGCPRRKERPEPVGEVACASAGRVRGDGEGDGAMPGQGDGCQGGVCQEQQGGRDAGE
jgi:hypothetical protein